MKVRNLFAGVSTTPMVVVSGSKINIVLVSAMVILGAVALVVLIIALFIVIFKICTGGRKSQKTGGKL